MTIEEKQKLYEEYLASNTPRTFESWLEGYLVDKQFNNQNTSQEPNLLNNILQSQYRMNSDEPDFLSGKPVNPLYNMDNIEDPLQQGQRQILSPESLLPYSKQTPEPNKNFLEYLSSNPMLGMQIPTQDKFMLAGMSSQYDPSFLKNPSLEDKAKKMNTLAGISAGASGVLDITKGFMTGRGMQKRSNDTLTDYFKKLQTQQQKSPINLKEGGLMLFEKGGMFSLPYEELMVNEYVSGLPKSMSNMANAEVEGGEYIIKEDGLKYVKGKKHSKGGEKVVLQEGDAVISDNLKIGDFYKNVSKATGLSINKNDTYANVLSKFSKSKGYEKILSELESYYKKLDSLNSISDENTKRINKKFLEEQISKKEQERQKLNEDRGQFAAALFELQESSKIPKFNDGGYYISGMDMNSMSNKYGLSQDEIIDLLRQKFNEGGSFKVDRYKITNPYTSKSPYTSQKRSDGMYAGQLNTDEEKLLYLKEILKLHGNVNSSTIQKINSGIEKSELPKFTEEEIKSLQKAINSKYQSYIDRASKEIKDPKIRAQVVEDIKNEMFTNSKGVKSIDGMLGNYTATRPEYDLDKLITEANTAVEVKKPQEQKINPLTADVSRNNMSWLFAPEAWNLPPEGLLPHAKVRGTFDEVTPMGISPEAQLEELSRLASMGAETVENLPIGMRAAANAGITSSLMEESNKAISATELFNAQSRQQAENINVQTRNTEELARLNEIPRYENLQLTALDKTLNDVSNYFNSQYRNKMARYNFLNQARLIDSIFPNVTFDPFGVPVVDKDSIPEYIAPKNVRYNKDDKK